MHVESLGCKASRKLVDCEACRAIQHAFSKPNLVNLISKDTNLVFYLSVYKLVNSLNYSNYDEIIEKTHAVR